jgi:hypothetical protein
LGEVSKEHFSRLLHQFLEIGANCLRDVFLLEGSEEAGFDGIPADFVDPKSLQAVPPGLGGASTDAEKFPTL